MAVACAGEVPRGMLASAAAPPDPALVAEAAAAGGEPTTAVAVDFGFAIEWSNTSATACRGAVPSSWCTCGVQCQ